MSDPRNNFIAALSKAQAAMPRALKESDNTHFRTRYADLASVQEACIPALTSNGFAVFQSARTDEQGSMWLDTQLMHSAGHVETSPVPLIVDKNNMQGFGSAFTYARRYGLMAAAGVAPDDDDGNAAAAAPPRVERVLPKQATDAISEIRASDSLDAIMTMFQAAVRAASEGDRKAVYQEVHAAAVARVEAIGLRRDFEERMAALKAQKEAA